MANNMNTIERLTAVANGEPTDRLPVFCNLLDQGARELGLSLEQYYSKGEYVAEGQLKMREKYGYDNLWSLFYVGKEAELLGCKKILYSNEGPPNVGEFIIKNYSDIHNLIIPDDIYDHAEFYQTLECIKILKREAGGKYPVCAYVTASMSLPAILMGMEQWFELLFTGPPDVRDELLTKCSDFFRKESAAYRKAGADLLLYSNPFGSTDFISMSFFKDLSLPWIKKDLNAPGNNNDVIYYCGMAKLGAVIESIITEVGLKTFYLSPLDNIIEAKKIIAGRAVCAGVINDIPLIDWTEEQIKMEVHRILDAGAPGNRFLFGTGLMPYSIPEKNIRVMLETAYNYGK